MTSEKAREHIYSTEVGKVHGVHVSLCIGTAFCKVVVTSVLQLMTYVCTLSLLWYYKQGIMVTTCTKNEAKLHG